MAPGGYTFLSRTRRISAARLRIYERLRIGQRVMWLCQTEVSDVFSERVVIVMPLRLNMGICPTTLLALCECLIRCSLRA
jgi:hypothetical protein